MRRCVAVQFRPVATKAIVFGESDTRAAVRISVQRRAGHHVRARGGLAHGGADGSTGAFFPMYTEIRRPPLRL